MDRRLLRSAERLGWGLLLASSGVALLLSGPSVGFGLLAGGALGLVNYACLRRIGPLLAAVSGPGIRVWWGLGAALRHLALFAALGLLFWSGLVHPLAVAAGLVVVPVVLIGLALQPTPEG